MDRAQLADFLRTRIYPEEDRPTHGRSFPADLRTAYAREGTGSRAAEVVEALQATSAEFREVWAGHEVGHRHSREKRLIHQKLQLLSVIGRQSLQVPPDRDPATWDARRT